jgi:hypothetical protein
VQGEAEGLAQIPLLGARLHFLVAPLAASPTFGPTVGLVHFTTGRWANRGLRVTARASNGRSLRPRVNVTVRRRGRPVEGAVVNLAGKRAETNSRGRAVVRPVLGVPGNFAALAHDGRLRGRSNLVRLGYSGPVSAAGTVPSGPAR